MLCLVGVVVLDDDDDDDDNLILPMFIFLLADAETSPILTRGMRNPTEHEQSSLRI